MNFKKVYLGFKHQTMVNFSTLSDTLKGVIIGGGISLLTAVLTAIISYYFNSRQQNKERIYSLGKEEFFKLQEKVEIILKGLDGYRLQIVISYKNMIDNVYFEADFTEQKVKERFGNTRELMSQYSYIYFKDLYDDIIKLIEIHDEIISKYIERGYGQKARTDDENKFFIEKIQVFLDKYGELLNKFLEKLEEKRNVLKQ